MIITENLIIGFGSMIAFFIVTKLSLSKILTAIKLYQNNINDNLIEAEKIKIQAQELLNKHQEEKNNLSKSLDKITFSAKQAAEEIILKSQKVAKENAQKKIQTAKNEIDAQKKQILKDLEKNFIINAVDKITEQMLESEVRIQNNNIGYDDMLLNIKHYQKNNSLH